MTSLGALVGSLEAYWKHSDVNESLRSAPWRLFERSLRCSRVPPIVLEALGELVDVLKSSMTNPESSNTTNYCILQMFGGLDLSKTKTLEGSKPRSWIRSSLSRPPMRLPLTSADARTSSDPPVRGGFGGSPFQRLKESSIIKRLII